MSKASAVAIVGRPNTGKSTLFNLMTGKNLALVAPVAGVTRDVREYPAQLADLSFRLFDTAGLETGEKGLQGAMNKLALTRLKEADLFLFLVDGAAGLTEDDKTIARTLRQEGKPCLCLVNKIDVKAAEHTLLEAAGLGLSDIIPISATHNMGLFELAEAMRPHLKASPDEDTRATPVPLAIVGRPNAGKSTLINTLLAEERMLTGPEAGLTREAIGTLWESGGTLFELVDTPGLRKKAKITDDLEKMSAGTAIHAIDKAEAVVLMLDATCPFERQDATIAEHVARRGKPMVVVLNKWDKVKDKNATLEETRYLLGKGFSQIRNVPVVPLSAASGKGVEKLLPEVVRLHDLWQTRLGTGQINRFLEGILAENPPPVRSGRRLKIKFMTQLTARPPTFGLWCNLPKQVPSSYLRFIEGRLRQAFNLEGVPLRLLPKGSENPYASKKRK